MRTADFRYELPADLIAQTPAPQRDRSRLLVLHRAPRQIEHRQFRDLLEYLRPGDVLALNNSRVIPARLRGRNAHTGGQFEVLLLEENAVNDWWAMLRPGKRARVGTSIVFRDPRGQSGELHATVLEKNDEGHRRLRFAGATDITGRLGLMGEIPLPPYISRPDLSQREQDRQRYQTVFAKPPGSVAAPTAGLHFTESLLDEIRSRGVQVCFLTLHVGVGTFAPVKAETIAAHTMHEERYELSEETARIINAAKREGRRVIAVGTTALRVLESLAAQAQQTAPVISNQSSVISHQSPLPMNRQVVGRASRLPPGRLALELSTACDTLGATGETPAPLLGLSVSGAQSASNGRGAPILTAGSGRTRLFIYPPYDFKIADALVTNFHLPRSTLLMLACAFAAPRDTGGRELVLSAYAEAIRERYRFFSYGDAMLIL